MLRKMIKILIVGDKSRKQLGNNNADNLEVKI